MYTIYKHKKKKKQCTYDVREVGIATLSYRLQTNDKILQLI